MPDRAHLLGRNVRLLPVLISEARLPDVQADVPTNDTRARDASVPETTTTTATSRRARTPQEGLFKRVR